MKVIKGMNILYDFTGKNFLFETKKLQELYKDLKPEDKEIFYFDHLSLNWQEYFNTSVKLGRTLILKDNDATIPKAQLKLKKLYYANVIVKSLFYLLGFWLLIKFFF